MLKMLIILYFFLRKAKFATKGNQVYADTDQALKTTNDFHKKLKDLSSHQDDRSVVRKTNLDSHYQYFPPRADVRKLKVGMPELHPQRYVLLSQATLSGS